MLYIHHIGFEVVDLKDSRWFLENYLGFHVERYMELNGEKILFLVNGPIRIELVETDYIEEKNRNQMHICFEIADFKFLDTFKLPIIEGPLMMENGWTSIFVEGKNGEIIEFLKRI